MRDKKFRLKQKAKYRQKAREIAKGFVSRESFKEDQFKFGNYSEYGSYAEMIEDQARILEKNRKKCNCYMCRNNRHNECLDVEDRLTIQERKDLERVQFALDEIQESA